MADTRIITDSIGIVWLCRTARELDADEEGEVTIECTAGEGSGRWVVFLWSSPDWATRLSADELRLNIEETVALCIESHIPLGAF